MALRRRTPPLTLYAITLLLLFLALGALGGGINLIGDPSGAGLALSTDLLAGSPFVDYLIPGIFLFVVFGLGALLAAALLWLRPNLGAISAFTRRTFHEQPPWVLTFLLGLLLVVWIAIQVAIVRTFLPLQAVMGVIGLALIVLSFERRMRQYFFTA